MKSAMETLDAWEPLSERKSRTYKHIWDLHKSPPTRREKANATPPSRSSRFPQISPRALQVLVQLLEANHHTRSPPQPRPRVLKRHESGPTVRHKPKPRRHRESLAIGAPRRSISPVQKLKNCFRTPLRKPGFMQPLVIIRENSLPELLFTVRNVEASDQPSRAKFDSPSKLQKASSQSCLRSQKTVQRRAN